MQLIAIRHWFLLALFIGLADCANFAGAATGTWQPLKNTAPDSMSTALLLTDGSLMVQQYYGNKWYRLTPDSTGSYVNGTWSALASMADTRLYYFSVVLKDGRVLVGGGEYGTGTSTVEIYDPSTNVWARVTSWTHGDIGDSTAKVLPDGRVMVLPRLSQGGWIYDPNADTWTALPAKLFSDTNDEESVVQLPDGTFVLINVNNPTSAQKYLPATNQWVTAGTVPANLVDSGLEIGPGMLLYDGRVLFLGATGNTVIYTPGSTPASPGTWQTGPVIPNSKKCDDAPACVMPNGNVLFAADAGSFASPCAAFEYDPVANTYAAVTAPSTTFTNGPCFSNRMLLLPTGQVMITNGDANIFVYTPVGSPSAAWRPTISSISRNGDGSYQITGTQLNGLTEGAYYGDDAQMSTNYPVIQLVNKSGTVYCAKTYNFSTLGVATGNAVVSASFSVTGIPVDDYSLYVIANGIASNAQPFTLQDVPFVVIGTDPVNDGTTSGASGNSDGVINPGETIGLPITLNNIGTKSAASVSATLSTADTNVTITQPSESYGSIAAGGVAGSATQYLFKVATTCPTPHVIPFVLTITDTSGDTWVRNFSLTVYSTSQISGTVTLDGAPLPGATVTFAGPVSGTRTTAADGTYTIGAIDGTYTVTAADGALATSAPVTITVPPSKSGVNFAFTSATVSGTVTLDGAPLAGANVSYTGSRTGSVTTAANGAYSIPVVLETGKTATLSIHASKSGYLDTAATSVTVPPNATANFSFTTATVSGTVTLDGAPLSGATITYSGAFSGTATTAANGTYSISNVYGAPGTLSLTAGKTGYLASNATSVTLPPSKTGVNFAFTTATVSGTVTDLGTGTALSGATIAYSGTLSGSTTTAANGAYSITQVLGRTATLSLVASKSGYVSSTATSVTLPPNATANFQLGAPIISVNPASLTQTLQQNTSGAQTLNIGNTGSLPLNWGVMCGLQGSLKPAGFWHPTSYRSHNGGASWYYGIESQRNYDNGAINSGALTTGTLTLPSGSPSLSFWQWRQTEGSGSTYDQSLVQVSTDGGTTWTQVYQSLDNSGTWVQATIDLTAYAGKSVQIRWFFNTVDNIANTYEGWYLDGITLTGFDLNWLSLSPQAGTNAAATSTPVQATFNAAGLAIGTYTTTILVASNDPNNPTISVPVTLTVKLPQTITFNALSNQTYGVAPFTLTATSDSGLPVSFAVTSGPATVSGNTLTVTGAGTVTVQATQAGNGTYLPAAPVSRSFNVNRAALTITANNASKVVNTANPVFSATYSGFVNGDTAAKLTGTLALTTTAVTSSPPGTYPITPAGQSSANYTISYVNGTLTVLHAGQTITFGIPANHTYGDAPFSLVATASSGLTVSFTVTAGPASVTGNTLTITGAGSITVQATQTGNGTYSAATPVTRSFTVFPAALSIAANDATKVFNTPNPDFSATCIGFVNGESRADLTGVLSLQTAAVGNSPVGTYAITPSGLSSGNYTITFLDGALKITPATPVLTWNTPVDIVSGAALSDVQLNATADVPGSFNYSPGTGTVLARGAGQLLTVVFTPDDILDYTSATQSVLINVLNAPPAFLSTPTATPNPAFTTSVVTFNCAGSDVDNDALTINWDFQDGATATGSTVTHAFTALGTYQVTATILDGNGGSTTETVAVQVTPLAMSVSKIAAKTFFKKSGHDVVTLSGSIPNLPNPFAPLGQIVGLNVNGATLQFTLNAKGQGKSAGGTFLFKLKAIKSKKRVSPPVFAGGTLAFSAQLKNGTWSSDWSGIGGNTTAKNQPATMMVQLSLNGVIYSIPVATHYTATKDKSGAFVK